MNILNLTKDKATVEVTEVELLILNSALNEICNGIEVPEFETRIGGTLEETVDLLNNIGKTLDKMSMHVK